MTTSFVEELAELRLQVELMALRVGGALDSTIEFLETGDAALAAQLLASDDEIDAMQVSLTERCYNLLVREQPMASDLRLVVSVIRVLSSLERSGDLCLRIANRADDHSLLVDHPSVFEVILTLSHHVRERFSVVQTAWASRSLDPLDELDSAVALERFATMLLERILELDGPAAVRVGLAAFAIGRSLDRIGDHTQVMALRLRYLETGDPAYLAEEVA